MGIVVRYKAANTRADLSEEARALGRGSMTELLLSPQVMKPVFQAAQDIREAAQALALAEAVHTGEYADSFTVEPQAPIIIDGNPRVAFRVVNDDEAAAPVEFGNVRIGPGKRILGRAGQPWHVPKGLT
jgi:hypothetical protein